MRISVIGTGYVGLVTGTCFAGGGINVVCVDIDEAKVKQMQASISPIYEPGLESLFKRNISEGRLSFTTDINEGVKGAAVIFLALPTPPEDDGSADLSHIMSVAKQLGGIMKDYTVVVDKSTVPVGTSKKVREEIGKTATTDFDVVSNPEFLREGHAIEDFQKPDRIVIGSSSERAKKVMEELYRDFVSSDNPILFMDEASAEMTKYAANAFLATKITFMNEIANLCDSVGADIDNVRLGIGSDLRIGKQFLFAGIGYGGSCFPKDVVALMHSAKAMGNDLKILEAVDQANKEQKQKLPEKVKKHYGEDLSGRTFALWGLAFKPDTDDIREAPSLDIIRSLLDARAEVVAFDPEAQQNVKKLFAEETKLRFADNMYDALKDADALLISTEWNDFREANLSQVKGLLKEAVIFDGRNIYNPRDLAEQGFYYESIGRPVVNGKNDD